MSYQYGVQIINNVVRYYGGDANISGSVGSNGAVSVSLSNANGNANGSGRLSGSQGGGKFRGRTSSGFCAGTWSAARTGG